MKKNVLKLLKPTYKDNFTVFPSGTDKKRKQKSKGKNKGRPVELVRGPEKPEALPESEEMPMTSSEVSELQTLLDAKRQELLKSPRGATNRGESERKSKFRQKYHFYYFFFIGFPTFDLNWQMGNTFSMSSRICM